MSRRPQQDHARTARLEAVRSQQRRSAHRRTAVIVAASLVAAGLVGGTAWAVVGAGGPGSSTGGKIPLTGVQTYSGLARDHVDTPVVYPQKPPVGGAHASTWQNCGVYSVPVKDEDAVHSLEHGAMWITYRPGLSASEVATIRDDVASQPYALVSPYPGLQSAVVASVWGQQMKLDSATDPRLKSFLDTFKSGSQAPEPGGECTGGVGTPQG